MNRNLFNQTSKKRFKKLAWQLLGGVGLALGAVAAMQAHADRRTLASQSFERLEYRAIATATGISEERSMISFSN